ncbi:hypothetical protein FOPE_09563 [Fonsecaea pedrosoi]|nr:hypothetical protein FOPE_09563 [Fonsecaea pedrosoi]
MFALDGSTLEGGGQLVRVALSIAAICAVPVHIYNIRAGRGGGGNWHHKRAHNNGRRSHHQGNPNHGGGDGGDRGSISPRGPAVAATKPKKPGGGLKESHLAALIWLARECSAEVEGGEIGSQELTFKPARRKRDRPWTAKGATEDAEVIELKNPGSVWLIWQAIFPYIVFSTLHTRSHRGSEASPAFRIRLKGGTNVPKSPSSEYIQQVLLPLCERIGLPRVEVQVIRRGWTTGAAEIGEVEISVFHPEKSGKDNVMAKPEGGGVMGKPKGKLREDEVDKGDDAGFVLAPFQIASPRPSTISSVSMTILAGSPKTHSLVETQLVTALRAIPTFSSPSLPIELHPSSADSSDERRLYILLVAHTSDGYALGRDYLGPGRKVTNDTERQRMVDEAVGTVVRAFARECERRSCVDEFAEDQLVVFQTLADGASSVDVGGDRGKNKEETGSLHTRTVRWVCREMLGTVFDGLGGCDGRGMKGERGFDKDKDSIEALNIEQD